MDEKEVNAILSGLANKIALYEIQIARLNYIIAELRENTRDSAEPGAVAGPASAQKS